MVLGRHCAIPQGICSYLEFGLHSTRVARRREGWRELAMMMLMVAAIDSMSWTHLRDNRCWCTLILFTVKAADPDPSWLHSRTLLLLRRCWVCSSNTTSIWPMTEFLTRVCARWTTIMVITLCSSCSRIFGINWTTSARIIRAYRGLIECRHQKLDTLIWRRGWCSSRVW